MTKNKHSTQAMQELIKMRNLKPHQLDQLDNLWKSNICIDEKFSNEDLYQFAWIMANASNYALSEQLFVTLEQQKNRHPSLNMLAKKLAVIFSKLNINDKKIHYELAANRLSHGSST